MTKARNVTGDLLWEARDPTPHTEQLAPGAALLRGFAAAEAPFLAAAVARVEADAPFRHMITPGGFRMSVAMTNCGKGGWITDRHGYRYTATDPMTDRPWPVMPPAF